MTRQPDWGLVLAGQPYPFLFLTISGAHLYGFASEDSDYDLRGVHVLRLPEVVGLITGQETVENSFDHDGWEIDLVTHDAKKFFLLLLKKNGYVLEQLFSPLVIFTTPEHEELKRIAMHCITRNHFHHYLGFAETQWELFERENPRRIKPLLYVYRVLLTGVWLMRTGQVEANLKTLNETFRLPQLDELIARKADGQEQATLPGSNIIFHQGEYRRLRTLLEEESQRSALPETGSGKAALHDLLTKLRMRAS